MSPQGGSVFSGALSKVIKWERREKKGGQGEEEGAEIGVDDSLGAAEVGKGVTFLIANKAASFHVSLSRMCGPF